MQTKTQTQTQTQTKFLGTVEELARHDNTVDDIYNTVFNFSDAEQHKCREELNNHLPSPYRPSEALVQRLNS
jgi:hypothetical protein